MDQILEYRELIKGLISSKSRKETFLNAVIRWATPEVVIKKAFEQLTDQSSEKKRYNAITEAASESLNSFWRLARKQVESTPKLRPDFGESNKKSRDEWLKKTLPLIPAGATILDAGAGEQQYRELCSHLHYVSQDFAEYDGKDGPGLHPGSWDTSKTDIISDICKIPRPDASFDAILCTEVFEHLPDTLGAIREFSRLLKPGGRLIITAPFCSLTHFAPYFFGTGYSQFFYRHNLANAGFEVDEIAYNGGYFDYLAQEINRIPDVVRRYAQGEINDRLIVISELLKSELVKFAETDKGSQELLTFGLHVLATKKA